MDANLIKPRAGLFRRLPHAALIALAAGVMAPTLGVEGCTSTTSSTAAPADVSAIVFIKRVTTIVNGSNVTIDVAGGNGQVIDYTRYEPGGSLNLLSPPRVDGTLTNLTSEFATADFNGADISFDANTVVFSMKKDASDSYHIYTVSLTPGANGKYEVHQLTAGSQDDFNPVFLAGQKIGFATNEMYTPMGTRADEYSCPSSQPSRSPVGTRIGTSSRRASHTRYRCSRAPTVSWGTRAGSTLAARTT
jgi:hypothetical protein